MIYAFLLVLMFALVPNESIRKYKMLTEIIGFR